MKEKRNCKVCETCIDISFKKIGNYSDRHVFRRAVSQEGVLIEKSWFCNNCYAKMTEEKNE